MVGQNGPSFVDNETVRRKGALSSQLPHLGPGYELEVGVLLGVVVVHIFERRVVGSYFERHYFELIETRSHLENSGAVDWIGNVRHGVEMRHSDFEEMNSNLYHEICKLTENEWSSKLTWVSANNVVLDHF